MHTPYAKLIMHEKKLSKIVNFFLALILTWMIDLNILKAGYPPIYTALELQ